tara:strand:+ start:3962 stop:4393 length:432 start_codon:yes stop_codon:yes gene_type:complete
MKTDSIISIRPQYAHSILDGSKTIELRRRIPHIEQGSRLWIYSTLPEGAVIGSVYVEDVLRLSPKLLWKKYGDQTRVSRHVFDEYFADADISIGIVLRDPERRPPIRLAALREMRSDFHPPQVIKRLGPIMQKRFTYVEASAA